MSSLGLEDHCIQNPTFTTSSRDMWTSHYACLFTTLTWSEFFGSMRIGKWLCDCDD